MVGLAVVGLLGLGGGGAYAGEVSLGPVVPVPFSEARWAQTVQLGQRKDVPYVPTPQPVVEEMLRVAGVRPGDVLYDLGSGDGRIVVTAAKEYGVHGVGIDIDPERIQEAEENARRQGVEELTEFRREDLFTTDLGEATVVTMYLLPTVNERLKPKLLRELRPGTRIVSHAFAIRGWEPEQVIEVDGRTVYLWVVPEDPTPLLEP